MAKGKRIEIGMLSFGTQKEAINYVRELLLQLESKKFVDSTSGNWIFFHDLLARHPDYKEKCGLGIAKFLIRRNTNDDIELNLERVDGTFSDVSWIKCVTGKATSALSNLKAAMRVEIDRQVLDFKVHNFRAGMACELCSLGIMQLSDCNADHINHFDLITAEFIQQYPDHPKEFDDQPLTNKAMFKIEDRGFADNWARYHEEVAELRLVHGRCNLKREKFKPTNKGR